ncbi:hypothetical protein NZD88_09680 [Chryseobacterium antibioticum]|uniref:DUF3592 domain-containing protein n=1 Tax=Chryseobacterium pyrolae TaxID=2987481 RepID=A0ABT2IGP9_9FLAO|nr:hypothetical protein [Chryseobacterium pyrolae]MCT2407806.1 hypothetical protein [Chryseobacterium pyrolae]
MNGKIVMSIIMIGSISWIIYFLKYKAISPPTAILLKNAKYTIGEITSDYYGDRARKKGNDFRFKYEKGFIRDAHQDGEFINGRKYLVVYDSVNIRNGYLILDKFDITDSLNKYHIYKNYDYYDVGWSLSKIPFKYDKSDIEHEVKMNLRSE